MSLRPSIPIRANAKKPTFSIKSSLQHFSAMRSSSLVIGSSVYVLPPRRLRSAAAASSGASSTSLEFDWQENRCLHSKQRNGALPYWMQQQNSQYSRFAYDDLSEEDSDREMGSSQQLCASTLNNVDEWKWKLTMLLRNKGEQEVVSRERKDRRDFEQLSALSTRMGLYSRQYAKVVVFSKVPLPNYRSDLDDKRPQREVLLPFGLQRQVDAHLKDYLSQKSNGRGSSTSSRSSSNGSSNNDEGLFEPEQEPLVRTSVVMQKILQRKSLQLRNQQEAWQESQDGQKMQEFRRSLPAYKERDALLKAILENQVWHEYSY